jgi:hypothetical protein
MLCRWAWVRFLRAVGLAMPAFSQKNRPGGLDGLANTYTFD